MAPLSPNASHFGLILPLCTSATTVGLSLLQLPVLNGFLTASPRIAGAPYAAWLAAAAPATAALVATACATTAAGGALAARWLRAHDTLETAGVSRWYVYGALLAAGHLLSVPLVAAPIRRIIDAGKKAQGGDGGLLKGGDDEADEFNRKEMATWVLWHIARLVVVDVPALVCFAEGVAQSFWII